MTHEDDTYLVVAVLFKLAGVPFILIGTYAILVGNYEIIRAMFPASLLFAGLCFLILGLGRWLDNNG